MIYQIDDTDAASEIVPGALFVAAVARCCGPPVAAVGGTEAATFFARRE
jgi:hypothetical protein